VNFTVSGRLRALAVAGIFCMGLGGLLLHAKIHWIFKGGEFQPTNLVPLVATLTSVLIVTALFSTGRHSATAQLINGMACIIGIVTMTHYMIVELDGAYSLKAILIYGTLADSLILAGKWALGQMLFEIDLDRAAGRGLNDRAKRPAYWRYLRAPWWGFHLAAMGGVYALGVLVF